jgi:Zn-dependent protease with chaperone function
MTDGSSAFDGYVRHPSLGDEAVWGKIVFVGWRLRFESQSVTREIPLVKLRIERDASAEGGITFRDPDHPDWSIHTPHDDILAHTSLLQQPHTRNQIRDFQSGGELKRRLKITGYFLAGFALVALLVSMLMGIMVRSLVARVPLAWEQELGDKAMAEVKEIATFIENEKLQTNLVQAVAPLLRTVPTNSLGFKFYLMDTPLPNAFALPGGHVVVTTSLLALAERPEEVAGVVAHELAHVTLKHGFRKIISSAGPYLLCRLFLRDNSGLLGVLAGGSQLLVSQSFSQEYELEADDTGWEYLVKARIDPRGLPDMLKRLKTEQEQMKLVQMGPQAFSSHPATDKRIRRLDAKWRKLKDKSGFIEYDSVKRE